MVIAHHHILLHFLNLLVHFISLSKLSTLQAPLTICREMPLLWHGGPCLDTTHTSCKICGREWCKYAQQYDEKWTWLPHGKEVHTGWTPHFQAKKFIKWGTTTSRYCMGDMHYNITLIYCTCTPVKTVSEIIWKALLFPLERMHNKIIHAALIFCCSWYSVVLAVPLFPVTVHQSQC